MNEVSRVEWKNIAMFLAGLVLAMTSFYIAEFRRTMSRAESVELINQMRPGPPWAQDRDYILRTIAEDRQKLTELQRYVLRDCRGETK